VNLQLLGGIWILQTFPAIVIGLYTRWFHRWALIAGWAVAMAYGTIVAYNTPAPGVPGSHFGASTSNVPGFNHTVYIALTALVINLVVAAVLTAVFRLAKLPAGADETLPAQYHADPPGLRRPRVPITRMTVGSPDPNARPARHRRWGDTRSPYHLHTTCIPPAYARVAVLGDRAKARRTPVARSGRHGSARASSANRANVTPPP